MTYVALSLLKGLLILQEYSPLSALVRLLNDKTLCSSSSVMLPFRIRSESFFIHILSKMEPAAASQINLTDFPSIGRVVGVTETPDILSVGQKVTK